MYDIGIQVHIGILEKFEDDEKHVCENVDGIAKDDKTHETILTDWDENIVIKINMILPKGLRIKAFDMMKVLSGEKHVTFKNYTIAHLKTGMNIPIQGFLRGIIVIKSNVKEYEVFLKL